MPNNKTIETIDKTVFCLSDPNTTNYCYRFYSEYFATVEIQRNQKIEHLDFIIPNKCKYLNKQIKDDIVRNVNRNSNEERIKDFVKKTKFNEKILDHLQFFERRVEALRFFILNWQKLKDLTYILVIIINIIMVVLFQYQTEEVKGVKRITDETFSLQRQLLGQQSYILVYQSVTIVQFSLSFVVYILCLIESLPIPLNKRIFNFQ